MDIKNNRLKIVFGLGNENKYERVLTNIKALDIEKVKNVGINLIIIHNNGYSEKIYFKFYRVSFIEQILFNSFKRIIRKKWLYVNKVDTISENLLP